MNKAKVMKKKKSLKAMRIGLLNNTRNGKNIIVV